MDPQHYWDCVLLVPFLSTQRTVFLFFPVFLKTVWPLEGGLGANLLRLLANLHVRSIILYRGSIFVCLFVFSCLPCYLHHSKDDETDQAWCF